MRMAVVKSRKMLKYNIKIAGVEASLGRAIPGWSEGFAPTTVTGAVCGSVWGVSGSRFAARIKRKDRRHIVWTTRRRTWFIYYTKRLCSLCSHHAVFEVSWVSSPCFLVFSRDGLVCGIIAVVREVWRSPAVTNWMSAVFIGYQQVTDKGLAWHHAGFSTISEDSAYPVSFLPNFTALEHQAL